MARVSYFFFQKNPSKSEKEIVFLFFLRGVGKDK